MIIMQNSSQNGETKNIDNFCNYVLTAYKDKFSYSCLDADNIAQQFVKYFSFQYPLNFQQLETICFASNIEIETISNTGASRGYNFTYGNEIKIVLNGKDAPCGKKHTILHEIYEIIDYKLRILDFNTTTTTRKKKISEANADQFAASVCMPDDVVFDWISINGFDVFGLREYFDCSYAATVLKFNDVVYHCTDRNTQQPISIISLLYERPYWRKGRKKTPKLTLKCYKKSKGFPFGLAKKGISKIVFYSPRVKKDLKINEIIKAFSNTKTHRLVKNFTLKYYDISMKVDMIIRTVNWLGYEHTAKILVHVAPSSNPYFHDLAEKRGFLVQDLEIIEDAKL